MKKGKFIVNGEIVSVTEVKGGKVELKLFTETDKLIYVYLKRNNCNPYKWNVSDFISVEGSVVSMDSSELGTLNKIEFSSATMKKLFTVDTQNENIDYCSQFTMTGEIINVLPVDKDEYALTLYTDEGLFVIRSDTHTLFSNITKLDVEKKVKINGVIYITNYSHYSEDGNVVSRINYTATQVEYA